MKLYYRISDNSYPKSKFEGTNKEICLMNFAKTFQNEIFGPTAPPADSWVPPMRIIADKCGRKTHKMLQETGIPLSTTDFGNDGSLKFAFEIAFEECQDDDLVYFCEDDYLHLYNAPRLLREGIAKADYVTLYDHPDKYSKSYNFGEFSKVIKTESSHWRFTISTCMTFATTIKTLKEDFEIWSKHIGENHPYDHKIFTDLNKEKKRKLAVCIPGAACHADLDYYNKVGNNLIEPWVSAMIADVSS